MSIHLALLTAAAVCASGLAGAQEIRPGVIASPDAERLPLPVRGYQVYMVGEMHGIEENAEFQLAYLKRLRVASGVRDVAIEEDAVYESNAQAFVDGKTDALSPHLCLRAPILYGIRKMNAELPTGERIRVHLTDVDSPAEAIRAHLTEIKTRLRADGVAIPREPEIKTQGLAAASQLKALAADARTRSELRTIEYSVRALQDGLEVDIGPAKGSPYLESREQAVASNIEELVAISGAPAVLVVYGADHVSRKPRTDAGPNRDQPLNPVALRLEKAGLRVYTAILYPLEGRSAWRGLNADLMWSASDGHLASGETMDKVVASAAGARYLMVDPKKERTAVASQDVAGMRPDAFVLVSKATAMTNYCGAR